MAGYPIIRRVYRTPGVMGREVRTVVEADSKGWKIIYSSFDIERGGCWQKAELNLDEAYKIVKEKGLC